MIPRCLAPIYLASGSPRRRELLQQVGISFDVLIAQGAAEQQFVADESPLPNEAAHAYVQRIATIKLQAALALRAHRNLPERPILCADTSVICDAEILGKPKNVDDATRMLTLLSGRSHQVLSALALHFRGETYSAISQSDITFCTLTDDEITRYVATGEPMDKAGAYAVQGVAAQFISRINGSYSGVMGLPIYETMQLLKNL